MKCSMCGRGRPRSQVARGALIPLSPHAGGDACAPRTCVVRSFRLRRTRARTPVHPGRTWFGHFAFSACGRGRPRSQVARGSVIPPSPRAGGDARAPRPHVVQSFLPIALSGENAVAPQGLPRAQEGLQPARAPARQPCRGFPVLKGFSPHAQRCARAGGLRLGESE